MMQCLRHAEVSDVCMSLTEKNVLGFDVAMNDVVRMSARESIRDLDKQPECLAGRERTLAQSSAKCLAYDQRHDIERLKAR